MNGRNNDRPDESSGAGDSRFRPVDSEFDYEAQADGWSDKPGKAEAVLESIRQEAVASGDDGTAAEARLTPAGESKAPKRYVFREPEGREAVNTIVKALTSANHYALVAQVVDEPDMYRQRWDREHTELERERLWSLACDFIHAEELVDLRLVRAAEQQRRDQE